MATNDVYYVGTQHTYATQFLIPRPALTQDAEAEGWRVAAAHLVARRACVLAGGLAAHAAQHQGATTQQHAARNAVRNAALLQLHALQQSPHRITKAETRKNKNENRIVARLQLIFLSDLN